MKKTMRLVAVAILASLVWACTGTICLDSPEGCGITITASFEDNSTKTTLQDGGTQVFWEPGDEIKIFYEGSGSRFTSNLTEKSPTVNFSGSLGFVFGLDEGFDGGTCLWAVYPYRSDATSDGSSVTTTLPSQQLGRTGSFAKDTNVSLAKTSSSDLIFYNVCGGVRFSVTRDDVKELVFEALGGESIAGKVKLEFDGNFPVVNEVIDGEDAVTLTVPGGGVFEKGKWYYVVALPGTLSKGFKMTFYTETKYAVLKSTAARTVKRSTFGSITDADKGLVYRDKGTPEPGEDHIVFKDNAAKAACVSKYDTDGDGEVSVAEAEAVTSFSGLFTDWKGVTGFDEIKYFKNVHSIDGLFNGCDKLVSITIPENITDLGTSAFSGCSSLTSVDLPSGITSVGEKTFYGVNMWKLKLPTTVTTLGSWSMGGISCVIVSPTSPVSIQSNTFSGVGAIFVPENLMETYKAMTHWSNYSSKLHPLSSYREKSEFVLGTGGVIDMGTSVKWAAYNVGATKPEEYGGHYAWGETDTKSNYSWGTYFDSGFKKYYNGAGGKKVLDPDDDVAHVKWGGSWRMPTDAELAELRETCVSEWTTYEDVNGRMVYSFKTGNKIFMPAAGYRYGTGLYDIGSYGFLWSSSLDTDYSFNAWYVFFYSGEVRRGYDGRCYGHSVRPVTD